MKTTLEAAADRHRSVLFSSAGPRADGGGKSRGAPDPLCLQACLDDAPDEVADERRVETYSESCAEHEPLMLRYIGGRS